jgi:hypothetical protein
MEKLWRALWIMLTTAFDIEFEVTDRFLADLGKEFTVKKKKVTSPY